MSAAKPVARRLLRVARFLAPLLLLAFFLLPARAKAQEQDPALFRQELEVIRLVNAERRNAGLPPLAWNAELTLAARGFARDTVENRSTPYCGHTDSRGRSAAQRMADAGYIRQALTAENSLCGYLAAPAAVKGWMNSAPHRANILNADLREVGVGYYRSAKGAYVVLDLGLDRHYAPLVIDGEAAATADAEVSLYLYDQDAGDDWQGVGETVALMVANTPNFAGATWEAYTVERDWTLLPGEGWRTVYVKTRDRLGRTTIVADSIYQASAIPDAALSSVYATQVESGFVIDPLAAGGYSHIQFSLNWLADDSDENFALLSGAGERINDAAAVGGNTFRLARNGAAARNSGASPLGIGASVAYFRLKIADNSTGQSAATLAVSDGSRDVASRTVAAAEFAAPGQYQEFAVPFTPSSGGNGLVVLSVTRSGPAAVDWDTTALYTPPQQAVAPAAYSAPGAYYRSSGVQARLVSPNGSAFDTVFSAPLEVYPHLNALSGSVTPADQALEVNPGTLVFSTPSADSGLLNGVVALACPACDGEITWVVTSDAAWLEAVIMDGSLQVQLNPSGLGSGIHLGALTLSVAGRPEIGAFTLPVTLFIGELELLLPHHLYAPAVMRR